MSESIHHRTVRVVLRDEHGNILMQRRSANMHTYPNRWTDTATGHVEEGETYEEAVNRELLEEVGVEASLRPIGEFTTTEQSGEDEITVLNMSFEGTISSETAIELQEIEVADAKWASLDEIKTSMRESPESFTPGFLKVVSRFY